MARPREGANIAYVPVMNAITTPKENPVNHMEAPSNTSWDYFITSSSVKEF